MTYLELCQRVRSECGIEGNGPASVEGQNGVYQKIIRWVADSWREIQNEKQFWSFMWSEYRIDTIAGIGEYTTVELPVRSFRETPMVIFDKTMGRADSSFIPFMPWDEFRRKFVLRTDPDSRPVCWTVTPDGNLKLYPHPDREFTVEGEGQRKLQTLQQNEDEPSLPEDYQMAIVWHAAAKWFADQEAFDRQQSVLMEYEQIHDRMLREQLPRMRWGYEALA